MAELASWKHADLVPLREVMPEFRASWEAQTPIGFATVEEDAVSE